MALNRIVELTLNHARTPGLVAVRSLADFGAASITWIENDKFRLRLRFADKPTALGQTATPIRLENDEVIVLGARKLRGTGALLFGATDFVETVVEADEENDIAADVYYEAVLTLSTPAMASVWAALQTITLWVDVEITSPDSGGGDDPDRSTWQFQVTVNREAYAGDADPEPAEPAYPAPGLIALRVPPNSNYRIVSDGDGGALLQIKSATSGQFHTLLVTGEPGSEALTIGPATV